MLTAMGSGFDSNGKGYLWHDLEPKYGAKLLLYLYDELLVEAPEEHSREVELAVEDAIIRSGAEFVKSVPMVSEGMVSKRWQK
jgi:DNA polymerase I-like protein with 3'-5' exonuclease and polymerase domains